MFEERLSEAIESHKNVIKEKKTLEDRLTNLSEQLLQEEEKSKQSHKHRIKVFTKFYFKLY